VADGIDAAVDAVQATGPHSAADRLVRQPGGEELANRNDTMLPRRKASDPLVREEVGEFLTHMTGKPPKASGCPSAWWIRPV
jgi:hypothetical protein